MASVLHLSKSKREISPSLGSDTLYHNDMHQSQVSNVNPVQSKCVCIRMCTHLYTQTPLFIPSFPANSSPRHQLTKYYIYLNGN